MAQVIDTLQIYSIFPNEYQEDTPYKYILDVIDHFSNISNSYLLATKEALEVFS